MGHLFSRKNKGNSERVYLDWASAAPVNPIAQQAFVSALRLYGNPSSPHDEGKQAKEALEDARTRIARLAGVKPHAVIFTSGATEANNLAISGAIQKHRANGTAYENMHLLYLPTMHSSALRSVQRLAALGVTIEPIELSGFSIDIDKFEQKLRPETVLVSVDAVCGETGVRFETLKMRRVLDAYVARTTPEHKASPLLHVDASQLPLVEPIERTRLGADLLVLDAQKVGGVRGIGAFIAPHGSRVVESVMYGGQQEQGLRPGTEPVALAAAFAAALEECAQTQEAFGNSAREARAALIEQITATMPTVVINQGKRHAPHILNLSFPGIDTDYAVMLLNAAGFAVSTKSACETDSENGSKVILAYTNDPSNAAATLRVSWGPETAPADLDRFARTLLDTLNFLARN